MRKISFLKSFGMMAAALALVGGGCASGGGAGDAGGGAAANAASVTFPSSGVTVDCAAADWNCSADFGGKVNLDESLGFGGLTITEMFSDDLEVAADTQLERLEDVIPDMDVVDGYKFDGDKGAVKITSSNGKTYFIHFNKLADGKVYQCQVSVPEAVADGQKANFEHMCGSMRSS